MMDHASRLRLKDSIADIDLHSLVTHIQLRRERRRVTWTRFHLPREQEWPEWTTGASDSQLNDATLLGPLAGVEGCEKVWLGRQIDDAEKAALIILWESVPALQSFEDSSLCGEFLRDLGCDTDEQALVSFQWQVGFWFGDDLHGRITRTALVVPYTGDPAYHAWRAQMLPKFNGFMPADCKEFRQSLPRAFQFQSFAWVDTIRETLALSETIKQTQSSVMAGEQQGGEQHHAIGYHFFRWNGNDAGSNWEEALAQDPKARESWDETLAKTMPPARYWDQERWDLKLAPCYEVEGEEEEDSGGSDDDT